MSHRYYSYKEKPGVYTRLVGLTRDEKKQLLFKHIEKNGKGYARDFKDAFPDLRDYDISNLLRELKSEGKIIHKGSDRAGYWEKHN